MEFRASDEDRCLLAGPSSPRHLDTGLAAQQFDQVRHAAGGDLRARQYADVGKTVVDSLSHACRGYQHERQSTDAHGAAGLAGMRVGRQKRRQRKAGGKQVSAMVHGFRSHSLTRGAGVARNEARESDRCAGRRPPRRLMHAERG